PAIGPVPAIYVPRSPGQISAGALIRRAVAGAGRLARDWAIGLRQRVPIGGTMPDIPADLSSPSGSASPGPGVSTRRVLELLHEAECMELLANGGGGGAGFSTRRRAPARAPLDTRRPERSGSGTWERPPPPEKQ